MSKSADDPWYEDGLAFGCTRCGACCTGAPGFVWVSIDEVVALARRLEMEVDDFGRKYVRRVGDRYSLRERPGGDCVFWQPGQGCTVYEDRPVQCRTYPLWDEHIESPESWERVGRGCPGVGQGRIYSLVEIRKAADATPS